MTKRKKKEKTIYKVYVTYYPDGTYYIGFSSKMGAAYDKYFGSNKQILETVSDPEHCLIKETLFESPKKAYAKMQEFLLQWQCRFDDKCLNDMINVRLRMSYLKEFEPISWQPKILDE